MIILGVDPGTRSTGVGVIETKGNTYRLIHVETIRIQPSLKPAGKLQFIYHVLKDRIARFRPDILSLENIFYSKDIRAMVKIGEARACAMLAASEEGIDVVEYPPARIKQSVTGNGCATKNQVQQMVKTLLNLKTAPPVDGADALAVAICHVHCHKTPGKSLMALT